MRVLALLCVALASACYAPAHFTECSLRCEAGNSACPDGTRCQDDGYCHKSKTSLCDMPPIFAGLASAVALDETSAKLSWAAATDDLTPAAMISYRVYQSEHQGMALSTMPAFVSVPGATSIQIAGLSAKTTYYFAVRAVDSADHEDDNTVELPLATLDLTPPTFAGVETLTASGSTIAVGYAAASDNVDAPSMITYRIYLSDSPGGEDFAHPTMTTPAGVLGAILTSLQSVPAYYVVVRAVDSSNNEDDNTVERSVFFGDTTPPSFTGCTAATGLPNAVKLDYTQATDPGGSAPGAIVYLAYQASATGQENFTTPTVVSAPGAASISVGGLTASTQYFFVVRARDEAGNIDGNTVERSATTAATNDTTPPTFGGLVSAAAMGASSVVLGWAVATDTVSASADIVYEIFQASGPGMENFSAPSYVTAPGATAFTVSGLQPMKSYTFVVRARDQAGNADTNEIEKTAMTGADNTPPVFAGIASANAVSSTVISLSWAPASDDTTTGDKIVYLGYTSKTSGGQSYASPSVTSMPGVTSVQVTGLIPATQYFFVVRAKDAVGNIDTNTVQATATTLPDTTRPVFNGATGISATLTTLTLSWSAGSDDITPANALVYDIYQATSAGGESYAAPSYSSTPGATSYVVNGLAGLTTYYFVVRARDQAGNHDQNTVEVSSALLL